MLERVSSHEIRPFTYLVLKHLDTVDRSLAVDAKNRSGLDGGGNASDILSSQVLLSCTSFVDGAFNFSYRSALKALWCGKLADAAESITHICPW